MEFGVVNFMGLLYICYNLWPHINCVLWASDILVGTDLG